MAFWRHLGRKSENKDKKQKDENINRVDNDSTIIRPSLSTGDLGESLFNSLHQKPEESDAPEKLDDELSDNLNREFGDLGNFNSPETMKPRLRRSRLSKNLQEILADLSALSHFQQFLESKQAGSYLTILNDIKNYYLLANSLPSLVSSNCIDQQRMMETDSMVHSLHCEKIRIIHKYFDSDSSDYLPGICKLFDDIIVPDLFNEVQQGIWNLLETDYVPEYLHSEYNYKYQLEIINGGKLLISDILYNDTCLFYFMEFMDQIGKRHWLEFWLAAENYRFQWNVHNASSDALIIYNKYFSLQATQPLGLSDLIRSTIEENICVTDGPGPDCFEYPLHVLFATVEKKCLQPFLSGQVYCQYVYEIVTALKNASESLSSQSKHSGSTCTIRNELNGSTCSLSVAASNSMGTLSVAVGDPAESAMIRVINNVSNDSLVIDLKQLNDPDSLWKRKTSKLSFGTLTPLGRFYREMELRPEKKSGFLQ